VCPSSRRGLLPDPQLEEERKVGVRDEREGGTAFGSKLCVELGFEERRNVVCPSDNAIGHAGKLCDVCRVIVGNEKKGEGSALTDASEVRASVKSVGSKEGRTSSVARLGDAVDEPIQENDLSLLIVNLRAHVHRADVRVVSILLGKRAVVRLCRTRKGIGSGQPSAYICRIIRRDRARTTNGEEGERKSVSRHVMKNGLRNEQVKTLISPRPLLRSNHDERRGNIEKSKLTPAIDVPSNVLVPLPSSSRKTSERGPASRRILEHSSSSTLKVDEAENMSSYAPIRVLTLSIGESLFGQGRRLAGTRM
jgi:hypothetical protein